MLNKILFILIISFFIIACSTTKPIVRATQKRIDTTKNNISVVDSLNKYNFKYKKFAANFSGTMTINSEETSFDGEVKIVNDSAIQITIVKMAFPFMKIILTRDSVMIIERLTQTCTTTSYSYFDKYLKNTDFFLFNSLFTANLLKIKNLSYLKERRDTVYGDYILANTTFTDKIQHKTRIDKDKYRINEFYIYDILKDKSVLVNYLYSNKSSDIETIQLNFIDKGNENIFVLKYYNLKKNDDISINFTVPKGYKKNTIN